MPVRKHQLARGPDALYYNGRRHRQSSQSLTGCTLGRRGHNCGRAGRVGPPLVV